MNTVFLALTRNNGRSKLQKSLIDNMININHYNGKIMENMNHIIIICNCLMKRTPLLGKNTGWTPVVCENAIRAKEVGVVVYDEIFYAAYGAIFVAVYDGIFCAVYRGIFGGH
eukprot:503127_1